MSSKIIVNVGDKFGDYTVITNQLISTKDGKLKYHVQCKCGKTEYVRGYFLRSGRQTCCKSCRSKINYSNAIKYNKKIGFIKLTHCGIGELSKTVYSYFKRNAKKRNIMWDDALTIEYLWDLYLLQNKKCALSGVPICFTEKRNGGNIKHFEMSASLDRIDSNLGYQINNIQWVHKDINLMKNNLDEQYFINLCKKIVNNTK